MSPASTPTVLATAPSGIRIGAGIQDSRRRTGKVGSGIFALLASLLLASLLLLGCHPNTHKLEPCISYSAQPRYIASLQEPFAPLTTQEQAQDWGKELKIGLAFARELDLYRAVTAFKRALVLIPHQQQERLHQVQYSIILAYYLGHKYQEAIEMFEGSDLTSAGPAFPALQTLLLVLQDAYLQDGRPERAEVLMEHLKIHYPDQANGQSVSQAIQRGDLYTAQMLALGTPREESVTSLVSQYSHCAKSSRQAQWLNALLPGAGYYYVGQKKSALTSFAINALFTWAAYEFYHRGYYAAGAITTSLEMGWYFGGINGAGLAAKEYNEHTYNFLGKETLLQCSLFPVLMIQFGF